MMSLVVVAKQWPDKLRMTTVTTAADVGNVEMMKMKQRMMLFTFMVAVLLVMVLVPGRHRM